MNLTKRQRSDLVESLRSGAEALEDKWDCSENEIAAARAAAQAKRLRRYADTIEKEGP